MPPEGLVVRAPEAARGPGSRESFDVEKLADLAQGGMGSVEIGVVRAGRLAGRVLAIKRLHDELARDPDIVSMFVDEAWLTAQIRSPHVVKVEAFAEDARGMFLASELVRGVSLQRLMAEARARSEPFTERTAAFIGAQVCAGLVAAHDLRDAEGRPLGLVHRDLTPGNVLVGFDGVVKIADFGIAKAEKRVSAATRMGVLKGKPSYVSPEQVRGGPVDGRADLFALGIVLFEMLAGRRPWRGKDDTDVLIAMMRTEPPRLSELRPDVSPTMVHLVDACLRKTAAERPPSAGEVRATLDGLRAERGFTHDDPAWLADFVRRNAAELHAWFEQTLAGRGSPAGADGAQAARDIAQTRVHVAAAAEAAPSSGGEAATTFYQHATPVPGAAAMAAALAGGPAAAAPMAAPGPERSGADELVRMRASTPQRFGARTELMPSGAPGPSSAAVSSAARTPPNVTEWMPPPAGPPALRHAEPNPTPQPAFGTGTVLAPVDLGAMQAAVAQPRIPPAPTTARAPGGGGLRIAIVFAIVFVLTVAVVGALLRSGVLHAP